MGLWGKSGQLVAKQWHWTRECETRAREKEMKWELEKPREKVKYLPLLSNTSYNSWAVSSRVAGCFRVFSSQRGDGWWELLFLTFNICHNAFCSPGNFGKLLSCTDLWENVHLVQQNDTKRVKQIKKQKTRHGCSRFMLCKVLGHRWKQLFNFFLSYYSSASGLNFCFVCKCVSVCVSVYVNDYPSVQAELSLGLQALPEGRWAAGTMAWQVKHRITVLDRKQNKKQRLSFQSWKNCLTIRETFRWRHQNRMNSCLTTGAANQQTVTDWRALSRRWRRGHCAKPSQLARWNRICFSDPHGDPMKYSLPSLYIWTPPRCWFEKEFENGA